MTVKRARASSRREEILSATVDLVASYGHQQVRVADVAARLGISASLVIYHFSTKEELVAESFRFAAQNDLIAARRTLKTTTDPVARVITFMRWYAPTERSKSWNLWIDGWAASMWNATLAAIFNDIDREWKQLLVDALDAAVEAGVVTPRDTWSTAVRIMAFADGLAVTRVAKTADIALGTITDWVTEFIYRELDLDAHAPRPALDMSASSDS